MRRIQTAWNTQHSSHQGSPNLGYAIENELGCDAWEASWLQRRCWGSRSGRSSGHPVHCSKVRSDLEKRLASRSRALGNRPPSFLPLLGGTLSPGLPGRASAFPGRGWRNVKNPRSAPPTRRISAGSVGARARRTTRVAARVRASVSSPRITPRTKNPLDLPTPCRFSDQAIGAGPTVNK